MGKLNIRVLLLSSLFLVISLGLSRPVYAGVICIHGHSGHIEYESICTTIWYNGAGLYFEQNKDTHNWVHFAVPTIKGKTIRYISLRFRTESYEFAPIQEVHVWDGYFKIKEFNVHWGGDWQEQILDLGKHIPIYLSLGITVGTKVFSMAGGPEFFEFSTICAKFD